MKVISSKNNPAMKSKQMKIFLSLTLPVLLAGGAAGQTYPDAGLWATCSVEYKLNARFTAVADEEFRLKENFSRINLLYTNLGMEYEPLDWLKLGLIYRNIQKADDERGISFRNRLMLDVVLKKKFGLLRASFRTRLQGEVKDYLTSENGQVAEYYMRNKAELKYDLGNRIAPFCSVEFRYQVYERKSPETNGLYHRVRPAIGLDYSVNDSNEIGLYVLAQHEWNVSEPEELLILGIQYDLKLN
jgi:hypothetical protein